MNPVLHDLRDIRGLDPGSWWPVPPGWWLVLLGALAVAAVAWLILSWWRDRVPGSWHADARRRLRALEGQLRWADARSAAAELSELLRRIAMARRGRRACAGLAGEAWLDWLERNDPGGFPWRREGRVLIDLPYAPPGRRASGDELLPLVRAALAWAGPESKGDHALGAEATPPPALASQLAGRQEAMGRV